MPRKGGAFRGVLRAAARGEWVGGRCDRSKTSMRRGSPWGAWALFQELWGGKEIYRTVAREREGRGGCPSESQKDLTCTA